MADIGVPRGTVVRNIGWVAVGIAAALWIANRRPHVVPQADQDISPVSTAGGRVINRLTRPYQQGCTSSSPQGGCAGVNPMHHTESLSVNGFAAEVSVRLRTIGGLADRIDEGADPQQVARVAQAIACSIDNIDPEECPE